MNGPVLQAVELSISVGARVLVDRLTFAINPSECWALMGPNGAGKSLLITTLAGLRSPTNGQVLLAGQPLASVARRDTALTLGLLAQDEASDFWGTTADYVMLGRYPHGDIDSCAARIESLLAAAELTALADVAYRTLSGGERQRARLAQLWAQSPRVLLLDEPLNHLDPRYRARLLDELATRRADGAAVLAALHSPAAARAICSHALLVYDQGRIVAGPVTAVLRDDALRELYGLDAATNIDLL